MNTIIEPLVQGSLRKCGHAMLVHIRMLRGSLRNNRHGTNTTIPCHQDGRTEHPMRMLCWFRRARTHVWNADARNAALSD